VLVPTRYIAVWNKSLAV